MSSRIAQQTPLSTISMVNGREKHSRMLLWAGIITLFMAGGLNVVKVDMRLVTTIPVSILLILGDLFVILAALLQLGRKEVRLRDLVPGYYHLWFRVMALLGLILVAIGLIRENPFQRFVLDSLVTGVFLAGFIIGTYENNWIELGRVFRLGTIFIAIPVTLIGILSLDSLNRDSIVASPLYRAQILLIPSTFFSLINNPSPVRGRLVFIICLLGYGTLQLLALKRAPLLRTIIIVLAVWITLPLAKKLGDIPRAIILTVNLIIILVLIVGLVILPVAMSDQNFEQTLLGRFSTLISKISYDLGLTIGEEPTGYDVESFRIREIEIIYDRMTPIEKLFGTGFGGYVTSPEFTSFAITVQSTASDDQHVLLNGRSETHIGMFWPFLKGGVIFGLVFYSAIIRVIVRYRHTHVHNALDMACWFFVVIMVFFQLMEGHWMLPSMEVIAMLVGACIGRLAHIER